MSSFCDANAMFFFFFRLVKAPNLFSRLWLFLLDDLTIAKSSLVEIMNHKSAESYRENQVFCAVPVFCSRAAKLAIKFHNMSSFEVDSTFTTFKVQDIFA